jgi:transcriptional regulator with XRE-family HTH domain
MNPKGREPTGLYPSKSRLQLSRITGINRSVISGILNGRRGCSSTSLILLAKALVISPERLARELALIRGRVSPKRPKTPKKTKTPKRPKK